LQFATVVMQSSTLAPGGLPRRARVAASKVSLSLRLTLALTAAALLLFGAVGTWQLRAEDADLRRAVRHDLELLGRALQVSVENALRDRQQEDVQETLRELERIDPTVDVFVYDSNNALIAASTGAVERDDPREARAERKEIRFIGEPEPTRVELLMPLHITREGRAATLVIARPLDDMRADLAATRIRVVLSVVGYVLLIALLTMGLSGFWVGRPLAEMIKRMKRVREGDLSSPPSATSAGEVGETLREFGLLVRDLRETRARLETEGDARRRVEGQLREIDKMRAVGQLAAGLAHEIGSPLQILEGRLAALEGKADDPNETRRVARILLEQAQRITRIVSRLTTVARKPTETTTRFEPLAPARTVVELLEGEARRRRVALTLDHEDELPTVEGDPDALQQILLNLIRNGLDATSEGGRVEVVLAASPPHEGAPAGLRIVVRDDGRGMDEATRRQAFEPFFTTRADRGGTGLGLAVVKGIADDLGAVIDLRSEPGKGTTFTIDVPGERGRLHR
jgi:signal transduction histidine kinase